MAPTNKLYQEHYTAIIAALASAVVHYQEHIDTGEALDLGAARGCLDNPLVSQWIDDNEALLPLRRDGKGFYG